MASPAGSEGGSQSRSPESDRQTAGEAFDNNASGQKPTFSLPVESFTLPNGLTVLVNTDHANPMVAVSITYKVGSLNEKPGRSGFAHLFEHLMFQGTKSLKPSDFPRLIETNGGADNAYTNRTNTTYYEIVPRGALEMTLWAEAERMHTLNVDARAVANEKQVVIEEMRRNYLNEPYAKALDSGVAEASFTKWENRHTTIGEMEEIRGADLQDVRDFYDTYYAPNNAVMALSGNVTMDEAREIVQKYFAAIPSKVIPPLPDLAEPPISGERRSEISNPLVKLPAVALAWHAPPRDSRDYWALTVLSRILSGEDENPLYQALVKGAKLAIQAQARFPWWVDQSQMRGQPELFGVIAISKLGKTVEELVVELDKVLERLARSGPEENELAGAKAQIEMGWLRKLESPQDRAIWLSSYAALIGDPSRMAEDLAALLSVTAQEISEALKRWMIGRGRALVRVIPGESLPEAPKEAEPAVPAESPRAPGDAPPAVQKTSPAALPEIHRFSAMNGLEILLVRDSRLPLVELRLSIKAGTALEADGEAALSQAAASLMLKGAREQSAAEIAEAFSRLGYQLSVNDGEDTLDIKASGPARNFEAFLAQLGRVLGEASYPREEVELWKSNMVEELEYLRSRPDFLSGEALKAELLSSHPYGKPFPDEGQIGSVDTERLKTFHLGHIAPTGANLVLTGDLDPQEARRMLESALKGWGHPGSSPEIPAVPASPASRTVLIDLPDAKQADLVIARTLPITPADPDYMAFRVMNHILGGSATSRLFMNLREAHGYTYGSYASSDPHPKGTIWTATAETRHEVVEPSLEEMRREVRRMRDEPVTPEELEGAKRYLAGTFLMRLSSLDSLASYLSALKNQGKDPAVELSKFLERLEAVTPRGVQDAARKYLDPDGMVTVVVGDKKKLEGLKRP